jgi:hypothetical protein
VGCVAGPSASAGRERAEQRMRGRRKAIRLMEVPSGKRS